MKTNITLFLFFAFAFSSYSQYYINKGNAYYKTMQYDKAIENYTKGLNNNPSDEVKIKLADSYRLNNDYKNAEKWYAEVVAISAVEPINLFYYAKVLMNNGKYTEAKAWFSAYLRLKNDDAITKTLIASCDSFNNLYADSSFYALKLVEIPDVTTAFGEVNYADGLVFAADRETFKSSKRESGWTGRSYLDLYFTKKKNDGSWTAPEALKGSVNGIYHEGPAIFNKKETVIYFTRSNYAAARKLRKNDKDESNLKIFSAELKDGAWVNLKDLPFNSDEYSCGHPALSPNGKTLYFISDMPGGQGGTDIYKITKKMNKDSVEEWSLPENLGNIINTAGNEMFPYVHKNGILYFSSDGHNTLGGLDIFSSSFDGKKWSSPENLNYPINSSKDDFAFILNDDNKTGYISSNRNDVDKIYEIRLDTIFILRGQVTMKENRRPIPGALVEIINVKNGSKETLTTDEKGNYAIRLKAEVEYKVQGTKEGYLKPQAVTVSTKGKNKSETFTVNFQLEKIQMDKPIVLENIYYDLDKWKIRKDAALELNKFVGLLNSNPQISVELSSHTDARADDYYNQVLSEKRAKSAVEYLIKKGIDPKRVKWKGYGESMLVNKCGNGVVCNEQEHQQNRRTEFKIIKIGELASRGK